MGNVLVFFLLQLKKQHAAFPVMAAAKQYELRCLRKYRLSREFINAVEARQWLASPSAGNR